MSDSVLSNAEITALIRAFARGAPEGFTEAQVTRWIQWCVDVCLRAALLSLAVRGEIHLPGEAMSKALTHGELFAGISGMGCGLGSVDIPTLWCVEIDPECRRVLAKHHPQAKILDDVREVGAHNLEPVDVITFGSPCQDLSVAGKRKGMAGERSGLFLEGIRVIKELRPSFAIWENVPGAFSSNAGRDFASVLRAFRDAGARQFGWRTLDSRWFGVAQRRRRVFVVADFRAERVEQILFESEGSAGNSQASGEARADVAATLRSRSHGVGINPPGRGGEDDVNLVAFAQNQRDEIRDLGKLAGSCAAEPGMRQQTFVAVAHPLTASVGRSNAGNRVGNGHNTDDNTAQAGHLVFGGASADGREQAAAVTAHKGGSRLDFDSENFVVTHTLTSAGADAGEDGTGRGTPLVVVPIDMRQARRGETMTNNRKEGSSGGAPGTGIGEAGDPSPTLAASHTPAIAFHTTQDPISGGESTVGVFAELGEGHQTYQPTDAAGPLRTSSGGGGTKANLVANPMMVRRLTPTECLRLQGFPDDHLDLDSPLSDAAKYRMCGNAITRTVGEWFGTRLLKAASEKGEA